MKALVTGGGGFLGRYIVEALLAAGVEVRIIARGKYPELAASGVECIQGDIRNRSDMLEASCEVDVVYHVAAKAGIWGPWRDYFNSNVEGTRNVVAACKKNGVPKLIYTSTPSVVIDGTEIEKVDESKPYPRRFPNHYAATKAMAEKEVLAINGSGDLLTVALRPHLVWGPRDNHLIPRLVQRAKSGRLMRVGDGGNLVDNCYVTNAADAHLLAGERLQPGSPIAGKAFFITQGQPVKLWDWINDILQRLGIEPVTKAVPYGVAKTIGMMLEVLHRSLPFLGEPKMTRFVAMQMASSHYFDISAARELLGYAPKISHEEGMKRTIEYFQTII
ncbi:NAD-dependent epimerase/dehydratase family protein [Planctomycetota bacterium]